MLSQHFVESHDLATVQLSKTFRRLVAGKGDNTGVAHHRRRVAPQKIDGIFRINEFGGKIVCGLQIFHLRLIPFQILGRTGKAAEGYLRPVHRRQDVPGMHVLVYPHAAEEAILPRFLCEDAGRVMKQVYQRKQTHCQYFKAQH